MQQSFPFQPRAANQNPPLAQANGAVGVTVTQIALPGNSPNLSEASMRLVVDGTSPIAWCYGNQSGLTYANGEMMLGNTVEVFLLPAGVTQLSVIALATGSTLRVHVGDGQ